jgi:hypothetical protein
LQNLATSLSSLDIGGTNCSKGGFKFVVEYFPNLEWFGCSLDLLEEDDRLLSLKKLRGIGIVVAQEQDFGNFFEGSSLSSFSLEMQAKTVDPFITNFIQLMSSMANLQYLCLEKLNLQGDEFKTLLHMCPSLTTLQVVGGRLACPSTLEYVKKYATNIKTIILEGRKIFLNNVTRTGGNREPVGGQVPLANPWLIQADSFEESVLILQYPMSDDEDGNSLTQDVITMDVTTANPI